MFTEVSVHRGQITDSRWQWKVAPDWEFARYEGEFSPSAGIVAVEAESMHEFGHPSASRTGHERVLTDNGQLLTLGKISRAAGPSPPFSLSGTLIYSNPHRSDQARPCQIRALPPRGLNPGNYIRLLSEPAGLCLAGRHSRRRPCGGVSPLRKSGRRFSKASRIDRICHDRGGHGSQFPRASSRLQRGPISTKAFVGPVTRDSVGALADTESLILTCLAVRICPPFGPLALYCVRGKQPPGF